MVPVDVCINLMCVMAWRLATAPAPAPNIPVFNCTSGAVNGLTWGRIESEGLPIIHRNPYEGVFWYPGGSYKENYYVNRFFQVSQPEIKAGDKEFCLSSGSTTGPLTWWTSSTG